MRSRTRSRDVSSRPNERSRSRRGTSGAAILGAIALLLGFSWSEIPAQEISPCATLSPEGPYTRDTVIRFDASCTESTDVVIEEYGWHFTHPFSETELIATGRVIDYELFATGEHTVRLVVRTTDGAEASLELSLTVSDLSYGFQDDFERDDGSLERWTPVQGEWKITDGALGKAPSADEAWIWAGSPPSVLDNRSLQSFHSVEVSLKPDTLAAEGNRNVGVALFAKAPVAREGLSGYTIEWIDPVKLFRMIRRDDGRSTVLFEGAPEGGTLPSEWYIDCNRDSVTFSAGTRFFFTVDDDTYRRGLFGLISGANSGVHFERVSVFRGHGDLAILRGDCDGNGETSGVIDAITLLVHNFVSARYLPCRAACDANADGDITGVSDAVRLLVVNFLGGIIPEPHPWCSFTGLESDFELGCDEPSPACW